MLYEDSDIDRLFEILDQAAQVSDDMDDNVTVWEFDEPEGGVTPAADVLPTTTTPAEADEAMLANVTNMYLAFNKENPSDLLSQLVKVLDKETTKTEGQGRKKLQDAASRVKGMAKTVADAWERRHED